MTKWKRAAAAALAAIALGAGGFAAHRARGGEPPPPSSMSPLDAARLHAELAEVAPHMARLDEICRRYGLSALAVLVGRERVDFETGAILSRQAPAPEAGKEKK